MTSYRPNGFQVTLARAVEYSGPGLHCGKHVNMRILPAPPGSGIRFVRVDIPGSPVIPARPESVVPSARCTAIGDANGHGHGHGHGYGHGSGSEPEPGLGLGCGRASARVDTVEHIMAAFRGLGVDNAIVELDGPEVPMGDGSAATFVELIRQAGRARQEERRLSLVLESPIWVSEGDKHLVVLPYGRGSCDARGYRDPDPVTGLKITFTFVTDHPAVGTQHVEFDLDREDGDGGGLEDAVFAKELAPARTVGFTWEIEKLREAGLALGGDLGSVVVIGDDGYLGPLRFKDEVARHKALDIVGDFALLGRVCAHIIGIKSNHAMNHRAVRIIARRLSE